MRQQVNLSRDRVTPKQVSYVHLLNVIDFHSATGKIHETGNTSYM
ncbi:hypothetical protein PBOI14_56170 [Pseudomonas sp. Boi14]|nr:hypothetical protein PBOI14_56170 [Pseudomonas sp. Boi14]